MTGQGECSSCGQPLHPGAKFCSECGARLATEPTRESRKTVTAVFADVVGSTPLQERIDAESAHHVMGRFYTTMRDALESHGGHVAKFIGDAVVGLFGFPTLREDDALRAVRAACAMRDALAPLNEDLYREWGVRIGMRMGVNTGEVVISPEGLAIGDTMNVAARLEQAAPEGEVLIGEPTWRHVRHAARCKEIPPLVLKGKRDPVPAYRLLDAPASGQQRVRIAAPLVGRDAELGRLSLAFDDAVAAGACRFVSVIGSAGIGKTRLAEELAATLGDRASVVLGRCEPTGEGITFQPVVEVLRGAAGIGEGDPAEVVREKLAALVPGDPDRDLLVERAAGILGVASEASAQETFWSVRRLLGGLARARPLVVVLDDVHWGEPTFLDLIEHLAEWGRESPILLLGLARPELRDLRPALAEVGRIAHDVVELIPLGDEQSRLLVDELLDRAEVPEALAQRVLTTTEGNPLFLGEMLRMLVDDGVLRRDGAGWVTLGDASDVEVPPTIAALLAARIDRLGADERSVVERAAVIGKQFYRGAVAALAPAAVGEGIDAHLESLQRKEVVEPDGTVWADEAVFRFHHVLIRDAAYRTLLKEARAELHERFADWLEIKVGVLVGEHEEVIAFHLEQAHDYRRELGPLDDLGRALGVRATTRLHSAGRRALAREDLPAAVNLLRRGAAALGDDDPQAGELLVDLLEALLSAGDTADVGAVVERLGAIAGPDPRLSAWTAVAGAQLVHLTDSARLAETLGGLVAAADALAAAGDDRGLAKAHHVRAQGLALLGRVGDVEAALDEALAAARRAAETRRVTAVLSGAPRAALWGPSPVMRASGRCLDVVRILRMSQGNRHVEAIALRCQAVLEAMRGRTDAARKILDRCRMALEELGLGMELLETEQYAGIVELIAGDDVAAEARLRIAYEGFAARNLAVGAASAAALLARAVLGQGHDAEAYELTRFSEDHAGEHLQPTIAWCGVRAQVLARRGEFADAEHFARRAVDLAAGTDALVDHGDARMALADALRVGGREDEAVAEARRAAELYEAKGHEVGATRAARFAGERPVQPLAPAPAFSPTPIDEGAVGQTVHLMCTALDSRDWAAFRAALSPDIDLFDRRLASPRGDSHGADAVIDTAQAYLTVSEDVRMRCTMVVDAGALGIAHITVTGHETDSGSEFTIPMVQVIRIVDARIDRIEGFNPEDEHEAYDRLLDLQPDPVVRIAWRQQLDVLVAVNAGDVAGAFAPDVEVVDHRSAPVDRDGLLALLRSHPRMKLELLDAAGDAAVMSRIHLVGAEGEPVLVLGQVTALRDGVAVRVELFEPADVPGMRACFERLAGGPSTEPTTPRAVLSTPVQQRLDEIIETLNRRDWAALALTLAPSLHAVDRRTPSTFGEIDGRDAFAEYSQGLTRVAGDAVGALKVFAGDDRLGVVHGWYSGHLDDGGGEFTYAVVLVARLGDDGFERIEYLDADDETGGAERLLELQPDVEVRAAWKPQLDVVTAFNARDWSRLEACFAAGVVLVDHREERSAERCGRSSVVSFVRSLLDSIPDGRAAVHFLDTGCDVAMSRLHLYGHEAEIALGLVAALHNGQIARIGLFDPTDESAMRTCFERLASAPAIGAVALATPRAVLSTAFQRSFDELTKALNLRDWAASAASFALGFRAVDRRVLSMFGEIAGRDAVGQYLQGIPALAGDAVASVVQFAGDDRVGAVHGRWTGRWDDGGGEFEYGFAFAGIVGNEGFERFEYLDADDLNGAAERLLELQSDKQVRAAWTPQLHVVTAVNARDWARLEACFAEGVRLVDHREARSAERRGRAAVTSFVRSLLDGKPDGRAAIQFLDAGREIAMSRLHLYGSEAEVAIGQVIALHNGEIERLELFDPTDEAAVRTRYEALRSEGRDAEKPQQPRALGPANLVVQRFYDCINARDFAGYLECFAEDAVVVDQRPVSLFTGLSREEALAWTREMFAASADARFEADHIGELDGVYLGRGTWVGHLDETSGAFETPARFVHVIRDRRIARLEGFDVDDEAGALRAVCRLVGGGHEAAGQATRVWLRLVDGINRRAWDEMRAGVTADHQIVDHRRVVSLDGHSIVERAQGMVVLSDDMVVTADPLAEIDGIAMLISRFTGHMDEGGGAWEHGARVVVAAQDGLLSRYELFDEDDEAGMLAAVARLRSTPDLGPATRTVQRYFDCVNARDFTGLLECCAEDFVVVDQRSVSLFGSELSREEAAALTRELTTSASDARVSVDHIGELDGVWSGCAGWVGHLDETGGAFANPARGVFVTRGGVITRMEPFDLEDEAGALRALCRLAGGGDGSSGPASTVVLRLADALVARDWDRVQACFAPDLETVDHRRVTALGFDHPGGAGFVERSRGLFAVASDAHPTVEPLAEIDGIAMVIITWSGHLNDGGGPFELRWRGVVIARDDAAVRYELFDEDDESGMLAAVVRLREGAATNRIAEIYARHQAGFNARDWGAMRSVWAEDLVLVDRRPVSGWPVLQGRPQVEAFILDRLRMSPDIEDTFEFVEGDDECGIVRLVSRGHAAEAEGGGELEDALTLITVVRDGLGCYIENHQPDADIEMLRARCAELRPLTRRRPGTELPIEPLPIERLVMTLYQHLDASHWESASAMLAADMSIVDQRPVSTWNGEDPQGFLAHWRAGTEIIAHVVSRIEVIAATEHVAAGIYTGRGRAEVTGGGGPFEFVIGIVCLARAGLIERVELFDPEDESRLLARFAELTRR